MATARILVTGGGTFLGDQIAAALLAEGAEVTLLVRPGAEARAAGLSGRARLITGDVWEPSSLRGRGRGHTAVIHTVGSLSADPAKGLTYQYLNFISARNVAAMCVSAGVGHMVLLSAAAAPWVNAGYVRAKREAEAYLERVGLRRTVIRAPLTYARGVRRDPLLALISALAQVPPFGLLGLSEIAPMPVDILARGVARITLEPVNGRVLYSARDLRRRNTRSERRTGMNERGFTTAEAAARPTDEDVPFGWLPPG
jgi:NADH dehydrogenase